MATGTRSRLVEFDAYGPQADLVNDGRVRVRRGEEPLGAVCRRVRRDSGLLVVGCRADVYDTGERCQHYEITLGRPVSGRCGGGYSVEGRLWVRIF